MVRNRTSTGFLKCAVGVPQPNYSRGVAQWLARNVRDLEVGGSNPPPPDGARPLNPSQTNEDNSRHYRRSTGPWDALKYQRAGNQHSKGSKTHPRLSPAETQPSCDASRHRLTGRSFFVTSSRPSQPSWSPLFNEPRRRPSNAATRTSGHLARHSAEGHPDAGIRSVPRNGAAGFPATIRLQPMCGDSGRRPDRRK